jgi:hypothetical protein
METGKMPIVFGMDLGAEDFRRGRRFSFGFWEGDDF